jgi:hypothetical protein
MAFVPPTLNILFDYWDPNTVQPSWFTGSSVPDPVGRYAGQLRPYGHTVIGTGGPALVPAMELCIDADCPARPPVYNSSEYWYWPAMVNPNIDVYQMYFVIDVHDVAAGFMNQHRSLIIVPTWTLEGDVFNTLAHWPYAPPWEQPPYAYYNPA